MKLEGGFGRRIKKDDNQKKATSLILRQEPGRIMRKIRWSTKKLRFEEEQGG